jgi:hypothetical protein
MQPSRCGTASTLHRWAPTLAPAGAPRRTPRGPCRDTSRRSRPAFRRRRSCARRPFLFLSLLIQEHVVRRDREGHNRCATGRNVVQFPASVRGVGLPLLCSMPLFRFLRLVDYSLNRWRHPTHHSRTDRTGRSPPCTRCTAVLEASVLNVIEHFR